MSLRFRLFLSSQLEQQKRKEFINYEKSTYRRYGGGDGSVHGRM